MIFTNFYSRRVAAGRTNPEIRRDSQLEIRSPILGASGSPRNMDAEIGEIDVIDQLGG
jgi:hypothetical protein